MSLEDMLGSLYRPENKSLKDNWFYEDAKGIHMFHMQREENIPDDVRHLHPASIGHAVSQDLKNWEEHQTALHPGDKKVYVGGIGSGLTFATGCTIQKDGKYFMFYTQRPISEPNYQSISLATSTDMENWQQHENNPILTADEKIYDMGREKDCLRIVHAFRDPFVFHSNEWYMAFTGRDRRFKRAAERQGNARRGVYNGCIGLAKLKDWDKGEMAHWKLLPPLLSPGLFVEMEVPQLVHKDKMWYLFFSTWSKGNCFRENGHQGGLYCYASSTGLRGKYIPVNGNGLVMNMEELREKQGFDIYGVQIISRWPTDNKYAAMGWVDSTKDKKEVKRASPPLEIEINRLSVDWRFK